MSANVINVKKVSFIRFMYETRKLDPTVKEELISFIRNNKDLIRGYKFGHIPGHRVYSVLLDDGESVDWRVSKRYF